MTSRNNAALLDSIHYLHFVSRYHLFRLIGARPMSWFEAIPAPTVEQGVARSAVMSVLEGYAAIRGSRDVTWENWRGAVFDAATVAEDRDSLLPLIEGLWCERVGRPTSKHTRGERVTVEVE